MPLHYTLSTDPWLCLSSGVPLLRPCYSMGRMIGTIGCRHPRALHPFPTHDAAIRATLDPSLMSDLSHHAALSSADILDLRVSVRTRAPDIGAASASVPCVRFNSTLDGYELHAGGNVLCWSRDLGIVAALLRGERFEPGFIRRVLDPAYLPGELSLNADAREEARRRRSAQDVQAREREEATAQARLARNRVLTPKEAPEDLSIDDLLDTL